MEQSQLNQYIELCRRGDTDAFRYIVAEYQQLVYTLAFRLLCDEAEAEDCTQDTFIKLWLNIYRYKPQYKLSTWIYKITCNICYDKLRRKSACGVREEEFSEKEIKCGTNQEDVLHNKELQKLIIKLTDTLSSKQKLVFTLSDIEDLNVDEIQMISGMSKAKIKSNLYLARKNIKWKIEH